MRENVRALASPIELQLGAEASGTEWTLAGRGLAYVPWRQRDDRYPVDPLGQRQASLASVPLFDGPNAVVDQIQLAVAEDRAQATKPLKSPRVGQERGHEDDRIVLPRPDAAAWNRFQSAAPRD